MSARSFSRDLIQAPSWPPFFGGQRGIFPTALEKSGPLQPGERLIQRAVRRQPAGTRRLLETLGDGEPMEFALATPLEVEAGLEDLLLQGHQGSLLSAHLPFIGRYLRKVNTYGLAQLERSGPGSLSL